MTKTFTATAILQLRDEGLLDLDDPLVRHVSEFAAVSNAFGPIEQVTLRRLLQHTSGLQTEIPSDDPRKWAQLPTQQVVARLDRARIAIPPGTAYKYSNLGFRLLGETVSRVSGTDLFEYLQAQILHPLGMESTSPAPTGACCARGHDALEPGEALEPAREIDPGVTGGEGGLWSCVDDLARWVSQQFRVGDSLARGQGQVLAGRTLAEMQRPTVLCHPDWTDAFGLGWGATRRGGTTVVGHGGLVYGFNSCVCFSPSDRVGVVVLVNGVGGEGAASLARDLLEVSLASRPDLGADAAAKEPHPTRPEWRELLGRYLDPEYGEVIRIQVGDAGLEYVDEARAGRPIAVEPTRDPSCFVATEGRAAGEELRFLRRADGAIDGLNLAGNPLVRPR